MTVGSMEAQQHNYVSDLHPQQMQYQPCQRFTKLFLSGHGGEDSNGHSQHRFTKDDIRGARVISQVDRKFVACMFNKDLTSGDLGDTSTSKDYKQTKATLVLIDQASVL